MSPRAQRQTLAGVLVVTLVAAWFAPGADDVGVALSQRMQGSAASDTASRPAELAAARDPARPAIRAHAEVLAIRGRGLPGEEEADPRLFAATQWAAPIKAVAAVTAPAQAAPVAVASAPPLQAPPLPFRLLGRYEQSGETVVFLQFNDQNLVVRVGDTVAEQYKVEGLSGTTLTLRYLPLNQPQTLDLGSAQ